AAGAGPAPASARPAPAVPPRRRTGAFSSFMRGVALLALAFVLWGTWDVVSGYLRYERGQALERQIETEQLTDLDTIWNKWTELSGSNPSSLLLHGPRKVVKQ